MLRSLMQVRGYRLQAVDRELGTVEDFYFDDRQWCVRYMVVNTGHWLSDRKVLISPESIGEPDWDEMLVPVALTADQVEGSPPIDKAQPVSRENEANLAGYYGWQVYWNPPPPMRTGLPATPPGLAGVGVGPLDLRPVAKAQGPDVPPAGPALRSAKEVKGYHIEATDGEIGHVQDFIVDTDEGWTLRYLVVDTRNWLPGGRKVLTAPLWARRIDWDNRLVHVDLSKDQIQNSPEFDPGEPVNREYEAKLYDYYGRPTYWKSSGAAAAR
jgi:hypothetical protein